MDEKQLQMLFNEYAKGKGFKDFGEFKSLMEDEGSRKVFFEDSNKELGFKDFNDFNITLGVKKKDNSASSATQSRLPKVLEQGANIVSGGILSDISKSVPETIKEEKRGRSKYDQIKGNENRFLDIGTPVSDPNFGKNKAGLMMAQVPNSERASWGMEAIKKGELQGKLANMLPTGRRPTQDELWAVSEIQSELTKMPESKAGAAFKQDGWEIFKKDPLLGAEFLGETVLSSLSALVEAGKRTIPTAIGMGAAAGAPIAGIGAIGGALTGMTAGMTTAGMNLSTSGKIIDALSQEGVDVTDRQSLINAFSDEKKMSKIRDRALKYGIPIAAFDAISGGVAGKLVAGAAGKSLLRKTLAGFGEAGIQSLGGMAGEASGQYLADGKLNRDEILLEGVAGLVTDIPEIVSGVAIEKLKTPSSNKKTLAKQVAVLGNEIGADDAKYNLNRDLANNVITPEEHEKGVAFVEKAVEVNNKIPETVKGENRAISIELIDERDRLTEELNQREEQKKGIDVAYHKVLDEANGEVKKRIDKINNELAELAKPENNVEEEIQQPIEDKIADIEKKRERELKERVVYDVFPTAQDGEFKIIGDPNNRVYRINENTGRPQELDPSNGLWSNTALAPNLFMESTKRSGFEKLKDNINAKYDAELKALEEKNKQQQIPDENIQQPIVEQPEIVKSVRVEQEPELPEGTKVVTLSGMEEGERVKAVEERKKKTTLTEKEALHNDLIDLANRVQKSRGNEKTNLQGQIRQKVRELNAKAGEEIYRYDGVSVRAKVKSKTKGERYLKIKGTARDTSGRAIKEDAVTLFDRSPEFVQKYEELADSPNITSLQVDSGNGVSMTADQIESALQDIADGIPSVQADNLLNALEEGFNKGYFDLRGDAIGQKRIQAPIEDFIGVEKEEVTQPMDEDELQKYLEEQSELPIEEEEYLNDLINQYESEPQQTDISREIQGTKPRSEKSSSPTVQPNEVRETKGEPKANISKEPIGEAKPKQEDVEPKSPLEQQYEEASNKKGEKAQQKAKEKLISDNFDGIVAQLMTKNKIKRQC